MLSAEGPLLGGYSPAWVLVTVDAKVTSDHLLCVVVIRYVSALADLAKPKAALPLLADERRLAAYEAAIVAALEEQPGEQPPLAGASA